MPAWVIVLVAVFVVGLAVILYGALSDRAKNRRRAAEMVSPPERVIPHLPADARPPAYVSQAQARRRPSLVGATPALTPLDEHPGRPETAIPVGYASAAFVTDTATGEAVLDDPLVLVCADAIETVRELVPVLEHALSTGRPLVVVAPAIAADVLDTLEVNAIQGKVEAVAIVADDSVRNMIIEATGGSPSARRDRQSGWVDPAGFGRVARWVSTGTVSRMIMTAP